MFKLARWAALSLTVLTGAAMLFYPGGTFLDPSTRGYSFFQNSLSDLGSTVAWGGQSNTLGAMLFAAGFAAAAIAGVGCFVALARVYSTSPATTRLTRIAGAAGGLSCAALLAAALTPEDLGAALHRDFSFLALVAILAAILLLAWTTAIDKRFPRRVPAGWFALELVLVGWLAATKMTSQPVSVAMLTLVASFQKVVAIALLAIFTFQMREAERARANSWVRTPFP